MSDDSSNAEHPRSVGRYQIVRRLGAGGMGSVFLARDAVLERDVALKLPLIGTEDDPQIRSRFLREARSAATLEHPYICRVLDAGEVEGQLFLAMAYIEGKSLADLVRAEGIPPRQVVALVGKLAIAMNEVHLKGVVHRDLKPQNVMIRTVDSKREPVIVDFGLARLQTSEDLRMTRTGQVVGTPEYMSPEQLRGNPDEIGPACDIYALGVILYELLTGRLPFSGPPAVMMAQILTQPPLPPSTHRPGLDPRLDAICLKALAKEVTERHSSMMELATALTGFLRARPDVSASNRPLAPVARPVESDSIPTGADTLVSQLLVEEIEEARSLPPRIDGGGKTSRQAMAKPGLIASAIVGFLVLAGIVPLVVNLMKPTETKEAALANPSPPPPAAPVPAPSVVVDPPKAQRVDPPQLVNSLGMKLNLIKAGEFLMGARDDEPEGGDAERPRHKVRITRPFYLGIHEVTQEQFQSVMGTNPSHFTSGGKGAAVVAGMDTSRFPAENVLWLEAVEFCNKLSQSEGLSLCFKPDGELIAGGTGYRLPTEAEWEYACRAGTTTKFHLGDRLQPDMANFNGRQNYESKENVPALWRTTTVGSYPPNAFGLYDMHGSVREWTSDLFFTQYYKKLIMDDPPDVPWTASPGDVRADRGGAWHDPAETCRSAFRVANKPDRRYHSIGFRVARDRP